MSHKNTRNFVPRLSILSVGISAALCSGASAQTIQLPPIVVTGERAPDFGLHLGDETLNTRRFANNDAATLLDGTPGVSFYTGGGVSSLPVLDGLGDDRLKITVDGVTITSACPNHMNPALSYIDPSLISRIHVYAGIVPVSQGGDSIGGAIAVKSLPPVFAQPGKVAKAYGNVSAFHRSNGNVNGVSVDANVSTEHLSIGYAGNTVDADNYKDGKGKEVAASRYRVRNNTVKLAATKGSDLWTFALGWQDIPFQGYPNQSMDMTSNKSLSLNTGYNGSFNWGTFEARAFRQNVRHKMDVLQDKAAVANAGAGLTPINNSYMPMDTKAVDLGYSIVGTVELNENHKATFGHEFHRYTLDDWWPPLVGSGAMEPNTFWNINGGRRDRVVLFSEVNSKLNDKLSTQVGARLEQVSMNTGNVQGYYDHTGAGGDAYETDAASFNSKEHKRRDLNLDLTASARYVNSSQETYDIGFSRKTRSPNLHERYTWANEAMMAGLMNNWFGDLNSYVGDLNLKPEVAYSIKGSADWHDSEHTDWQLEVAPFYTYVKDYINVIANPSLNMWNMSGLLGRQSLRFANQDAQLYGVDATGKKAIGKAYGDWTLRAALNYTRGKTTSGDNLYNIMPLNARLAIDHSLGSWSNTLEEVFVSDKDDVSAIRAELPTSGYALTNYRTTYKFNKYVSVNAGIDNIFNQQYNAPLGGLEYATASGTVAPKLLRSPGRSVNVGLSVSF